MHWSRTTTTETVHHSEDERFSSEELDNGTDPAGVKSLRSSTTVEAKEEKKGKFTSTVERKYLFEKITLLWG